MPGHARPAHRSRVQRPQRSRRRGATPPRAATENPAVVWSSRTPRVASACSPRNPALASTAIETRKVRSSSRRAAASLANTPSATFTPATVSTNQKWEGWCSQRRSISGSATSSPSAANGSASTVIHSPSRRLMGGLSPGFARRPRIPPGGLPASWRSMRVIPPRRTPLRTHPCQRAIPLSGGVRRHARRASSSRTGWAMPSSCTWPSSTKVTPADGAASATRPLTRTRPALA